MTVRVFGNGISLSEDEINRVATCVLQVIRKELPKKLQCKCVIDEVLNQAKNNMSAIPLNL